MALPITQVDISKEIGRTVKSPILISSIEHFNSLDLEAFLSFFSPVFEELSWDYYDVKRLQIDYLQSQFIAEAKEIGALLKDYYTKETDISVFDQWISQLTPTQAVEFKEIQPWRRRSVCQFIVSKNEEGLLSLERKTVPQFAQALDAADIRSWPRVFDESPANHVENDLFHNLLKEIYAVVEKVSQPTFRQLEITSHFMSVRALPQKPGDNSPEGAHEDGADFIISALVVNRKNLKGGESQVIELLEDGQKEIICRHTLQPGEFVFQADSKDELIYGNDLWHHVTPFHMADESGKEAWRDIIGLDINLIS